MHVSLTTTPGHALSAAVTIWGEFEGKEGTDCETHTQVPEKNDVTD